jgi:serine protease AprX
MTLIRLLSRGLVASVTLWACSWATAEPTAAKLHVMLQGPSADAMRQLVREHRGSLTHYLPVINAVGAELDRSQLDAILATGQVTRHIDDLSVRPLEPDAPGTPDCDVGGALQFDFHPGGFSWRLYNKTTRPARLKHLALNWPPELGNLKALSIGKARLELKAADKPGKLEHQFTDEQAPAITGTQAIRADFERDTPVLGPAGQAQFELQASFADNCSASSVAAYANNHDDFYYSSVAEADRLHLHGIRGQGVTVAVLDSGLWEHPALVNNTEGKNRVLARYDAIADARVDVAFDESGHGTHLTSVLAHSGPTLVAGKPTGSYKGIAPDVSLVTVKAFNIEGQGDMLDIVRGVQWVIDNREKYGIGILNLSFASRPRWPYFLDPVNQAVMQAWNAGIVVVAAAGNEGPEPMTVGSPGNLPYIITVGAVTDSWTPIDRSDDYIPDFSSRGPTPEGHIKPDLVAPGGHITGITRPGSSLTTEHPEYELSSGEFVMTGSSQAAALVSGLAALLLQLEPGLQPDNVKCMLTSSAELAINRDGLLAYSPFQQGHGLVSLTRAITLGDRDCGNSGLDLKRDIAGEEHYEGPAIVNEAGDVSLPGLESMLSPSSPAKGLSDTRVWGVKAHIERLPPDTHPKTGGPFDWLKVYENEKARIEALGSGNGR